MNIHEHQAKELLKKFGAPVSKGVVIFSLDEIDEKIQNLNSKEFVLKAQIHAGGRGKGGGVKLVKNISELKDINKSMKFSQWFLDPVSKSGPDYFKNKSRILDKSKHMDASFITTDPKSLDFEIIKSSLIFV